MNNLQIIIPALLSGLLSGVVVAVLNYLFTKRKTQAEIRKLEAETEKIRLEIDRSIETISATVNYQLASSNERIIYDSNQSDIGYDFQGYGDYIYELAEGKYKEKGIKGDGMLNFEKGGVINIQRNNVDGRYSVFLKRYSYNGTTKQLITKDDLIAGQRNVRLSCEAKIVGGKHTLRFVFKNESAGKWLASEKRRITDNVWTPLTLYFQFAPTEECRLRIDDEDVSQAPSSVQIRNLLLVEKLS